MINLNRAEAVHTYSFQQTLPKTGTKPSQKNQLTFKALAFLSRVLTAEAADSQSKTIKAVLNSLSPWTIVAVSIAVLAGGCLLRKKCSKNVEKPLVANSGGHPAGKVDSTEALSKLIQSHYLTRNKFDPNAMFFEGPTLLQAANLNSVLAEFPIDELMAMIAFIKKNARTEKTFSTIIMNLGENPHKPSQAPNHTADKRKIIDAFVNVSLEAITKNSRAKIYYNKMDESTESKNCWLGMMGGNPHTMICMFNALLFKAAANYYAPEKQEELIPAYRTCLEKFGGSLDIGPAAEVKEKALSPAAPNALASPSAPPLKSAFKAVVVPRRKQE